MQITSLDDNATDDSQFVLDTEPKITDAIVAEFNARSDAKISQFLGKLIVERNTMIRWRTATAAGQTQLRPAIEALLTEAQLAADRKEQDAIHARQSMLDSWSELLNVPLLSTVTPLTN